MIVCRKLISILNLNDGHRDGASDAGQEDNAASAGVSHDHVSRGDAISDDGDGDRQGDGKSKGFVGGLLSRARLALFGKREPESDLNLEMIEELHMMTGCKASFSSNHECVG